MTTMKSESFCLSKVFFIIYNEEAIKQVQLKSNAGHSRQHFNNRTLHKIHPT